MAWPIIVFGFVLMALGWFFVRPRGMYNTASYGDSVTYDSHGVQAFILFLVGLIHVLVGLKGMGWF